jgi:hypothetical protein
MSTGILLFSQFNPIILVFPVMFSSTTTPPSVWWLSGFIENHFFYSYPPQQDTQQDILKEGTLSYTVDYEHKDLSHKVMGVSEK